MSEVNDSWIKPELKREMESLAEFMHPLNGPDREIFREGFRSALATIKYDELQSQLEACKRENEILRSKETQFKSTLEATIKERDGIRHEFKMLQAGSDRQRDQLTEAVKALEFALIYNPDVDKYKIKHTVWPKLKETLAKIKGKPKLGTSVCGHGTPTDRSCIHCTMNFVVD